MLFKRFYAGAGVCSPTRASVLTGRNNKRSCIDGALACDHMDPAWSCSMGKGMTRNLYTIAHAAKAANAGYMTQVRSLACPPVRAPVRQSIDMCAPPPPLTGAWWHASN